MATVNTLAVPDSALLSRTGADAGGSDAAPRQLLGRASIAGAGSIYQQVVAFLSGVIIARVIGAADYGIFSLARNLLDATSILTRVGLDVGLQRFLGQTRDAPEQMRRMLVLRELRFTTALLSLLPVTLVALGLGKVLEDHVYMHAGFARVLLCLALALPFVTDIAVLGGAYRGVLRPAPTILAECVLMPTARLLIIVLLFVAGWRLWAVALGTTLGAVLASGWLALRARRDFAASGADDQVHAEVRRVISYSSVLAAAMLVTTLTATMDILTLGRYVPAEELGQYSLAKTLVLLTGFFSAAFSQGIGALVAARHACGDHVGMLHVIRQTLRWIALGTVPVSAVFLLWGAQLMPLFGPSFTVPASVMAWLAAAQFVVAMLGTMGWALSMTNRHLLELAILAAGLVLAIVLCLAIVPTHGQLGAAIATFCAIAFVNGGRVLFARRVLRGFPFDVPLMLIIAAGLGLAVLARLVSARLPFGGPGNAVAGILFFGLCYLAIAWRYARGALLEVRRDATG